MCRSVRFSFSGLPKFVADCVCESCRRAHGASAVGWVGVAAPQFRIDGGEDCLEWYLGRGYDETADQARPST